MRGRDGPEAITNYRKRLMWDNGASLFSMQKTVREGITVHSVDAHNVQRPSQQISLDDINPGDFGARWVWEVLDPSCENIHSRKETWKIAAWGVIPWCYPYIIGLKICMQLTRTPYCSFRYQISLIGICTCQKSCLMKVRGQAMPHKYRNIKLLPERESWALDRQ